MVLIIRGKMKEHIYSIPLTVALEEGCSCVLCSLEKKLEQQAVTYFLGPSMMEPDSRTLTNNKGFCPTHLQMLFDGNNRLSLALMLETHVKELSERLEIKKSSGMFAKGISAALTGEAINNSVKSCALCDKLNAQICAASENLSYLWGADEDFRKMFENSNGLCLAHTALALSTCEKELQGKKRDDFVNLLITMQKKKLSSLYDDLHSFVLSFDYRNAGKELSEKEKESVASTVKHLSKYEKN